MEEKIFLSVTKHELENLITDCIKKCLLDFKTSLPQPYQISSNDEMITRKEARAYMHTSLVSLDKWTRQGKITAYRISGRIVYKKIDILQAMKEMRHPIIL